MNIEHLKENGIDIAVVSGDETVIVDVQSALDLAMTVKYETGAERIVIDKAVICGDFFILSTGMAGDEGRGSAEIDRHTIKGAYRFRFCGLISQGKASLRRCFSSAYFWIGRGLAQAEPGPSTSMP